MTISRAGLSIALATMLVLGSAGGFLVGRRWKSAEKLQRNSGSMVLPTGAVAPSRAPSVAGRDARNSTNPAATSDLAGLPPAELWRQLIEIKDSAAKTDAVRRLLNSMPITEWPLWMCKMMEGFKYGDFDERDPAERAALFGSLQVLIECIVDTHPDECLTGILELDRKELSDYELVEGVLRTWARADLQAARSFYEKEILGRKHFKAKELAGGLAREMARTNPQGALEWAQNLPKGDGARASGVASAFEAILKADRDQAIALLISRTELPGRPELAERIALNWCASEPARAWAWAQDLPGDLRRGSIKTVFDLWAGKDFAVAKAALETSSAEAKGVLLQSVAQHAPKDQIGAVAEMVAREPITMSRAAASQDLMVKWTIWDSSAASEWLGQQPPGMVQDQAIVGLISGLSNSGDANEPQAALEWAATISHQELRGRKLEELMGRFRAAVPSEARSWVDSTTRLTEAERTRFREVIGK